MSAILVITFLLFLLCYIAANPAFDGGVEYMSMAIGSLIIIIFLITRFI